MVNSGALELQREQEKLLRDVRKRFSATGAEALAVKEEPITDLFNTFRGHAAS